MKKLSYKQRKAVVMYIMDSLGGMLLPLDLDKKRWSIEDIIKMFIYPESQELLEFLCEIDYFNTNKYRHPKR